MTDSTDHRVRDSVRCPSRRHLLAVAGAACGGLVAGCLGDGTSDGSETAAVTTDAGREMETDGLTTDAENGTETDDGMAETGRDTGDGTTGGRTATRTAATSDGSAATTTAEQRSLPDWQTAELTTVRDDEQFTLGGLDGPVVVQSFAVWCPKCQRQSEVMADLSESVTVVGLNTDPNEDAEKVRTHAEENGFDWRFAVAPTEMTRSLVDEFGTTVTNAPSTPVIVTCDSGESTFMSGSIADAASITAAADDC